ncbi:MAG: right-handed parallel beta-helix repeat-containing protein, partial [Caldilineaceae bacterium]
GDFFTFVDGESGLYVRDAKLYENWVRPLTPIQNPKDDASGGGAVHVDGGGHVVIERSQIYDNYTANSRGGGAIISSGVLVLLDVAISRNEARLQGVSKTFGGAILFDPSDGRLSRVSIHHNKARFAGGIYARPGTNIFIANATVSNNDADFSTGIALGSPAYGTGQDGGESGGQIRLYHSTVARNDNKFGDLENIDSFGHSSTIVLANSVIDGPCAGGPYYTGGGNRYVAREDNTALESCARVAWPALANDFSATDLKLNYALDLKLQQSTVNGGPNLSEAEFISIKGSNSSPIVDAGQAPGCTDPNAIPLIRGVDQISGARPVGPNCDSGAMEIGTLPPNFEAIPDAGQGLFFPLVVVSKATSTEQTLKLRNTGGGVIQYFAEIEPGWTGAFAPISDNMAGA